MLKVLLLRVLRLKIFIGELYYGKNTKEKKTPKKKPEKSIGISGAIHTTTEVEVVKKKRKPRADKDEA